MAIILDIGLCKFLVESVKDAQAIIAGMQNAKQIDTPYGEQRKEMKKHFGTDMYTSSKYEVIASVSIEQKAPITEKQYKDFLKALEKKEEDPEPVLKVKASPEQAAKHLQKMREALS